MNVIILGGSGHWHFATDAMKLDPNIRVLGIAPGRPEEDLTSLRAALPSVPVYDDWRALLDRADAEIAVVNPWFSDTARLSMACLRRGLHVYSEKPLATELPLLDELEQTWRASGKALGGMFNYRCSPWFQSLEQAVRSGEIGEVRQIRAQKSYRMGTRADFYRHRETMGGLIPWVAIHGIDWLTALGGRCEWVSAAHSARENRGHGDMEVTSSVLMGMQRGVIGAVDADFFRPTGSARHDDDRLRVTGTRGMIEAVDGRVYLENESPKRELPLPEPKNAFLEFVRMARSNACASHTLDALHITRVALLARASADQNGTRIPVK